MTEKNKEIIREIKEKIKDIKGIITQTYNGNRYTFWHIADIVHPYVSQFLEKEFPSGIILREFNKIDHVVLKENLPVEVQSTPAYNYKNGKQHINHSAFEEKIEKQLKQNIDKYGKCLFFFDSEYLRYLINDIMSASRINWDWLYQYIKNGKLRVFVIRYDGIIKEVFLKDFEFISKISQTCPVRRDSDERILERNKLAILNNVLIWYKYTNVEYNKMYNTFKSSGQFADFDEWLNRDGHTNREILYYYINRAMNTLRHINNVLALRVYIDKKSHIRTYSHYMKILGLIDAKDVGRQSDMRIFTDHPKIAEYFPGYLENKELWDSLKEKYIRYHTFCGLATGEIDEREMNCQISIEKGWLS